MTARSEPLSPLELKRVIIRSGGLWSISEVARLAGEGARRWPGRPGFPQASARTGQSNLYSGWSIYNYMEEAGHYAAAEKMYARLKAMKWSRD